MENEPPKKIDRRKFNRGWKKGQSGNPKGNPAALQHPKAIEKRFKPGESGNPGGRLRTTPVTWALRELAECRVSDLAYNESDNPARASAKVIIQKALKGDIKWMQEFLNRIEGTPRQSIEHSGAVDDDGNPLAITVKLVKGKE
jgi:Family of unknown function (DUF5681)